MAIEIRPFTSEHVEAMKAFNRRLARGAASTGSRSRQCRSGSRDARGSPLYNEYFVALEGDAVRGAYRLKPQPFAVRDEVVMIAALTLPLSEGIIDPRYAVVGIQLSRTQWPGIPSCSAWGWGASTRRSLGSCKP